MEPLVELPRKEWLTLRDQYRATGLEGAVASCMLDMQYSLPQLTEEFGFKVYCPEGDLKNGMVAVCLRHGYNQVIIQPIGKDIMKIEEALLTTNIIDWQCNIMVPSASSIAVKCLEKIKHRLGIKLHYEGEDMKAYKHLLCKHSKKFENLVMPPNTYIGWLKPEHLGIVDKTWTYHSDHTYSFFNILLKNNLIYALYSETNTDGPLAWISVNEFGALTHLYCLKEFRRKGYGELVTKYAINEMLDKGRDILAYTVKENVNPQNMFRKLGFQDLGYDYWVFVTDDI